MWIAHQMLRGENRQFIIEKFKAPLHKFLIFIAKRLPEPDRDNVMHPNTFKLLDIRDKFFKLESNPSRKALFEAAWRILITEYEHDPYYRYRLDWIVEQIINTDWHVRPIGHPNCYWNEKEPFGGGHLIKNEKLKELERRVAHLDI